jgi:CDP-4-dehydro-6-deoxyglucose reductase
MVALTFDGVSVEAPEGTTVLAALEAAGVPIDSSCRAGVCQSCLVQSIDGDPPRAAQAGLPKALALDGYFLACLCVPQTSMTIGRAGAARQRVTVVVRAVEHLSDTVVRLRLEPKGAFSARAGQFVTLVDEETGAARSYSIAGLADGLIELHIRMIPGGVMSGLIAHRVRPGDLMTVAGPSGACFYDGLGLDREIVLAGAGTGLAPLWGILNDAMAAGHRGPITLYHGALDASGLYLVEELAGLQDERPQFTYRPCILNADAPNETDLVKVVTRAQAHPAQTSYFLCGDELLVNRLKRGLFIAGAKLDSIQADPFLPAKNKTAA